MRKSLLKALAVFLTGISTLAAVEARAESYVLMLTLRSEVGTQMEMPFPVREGTLARCNFEKKNNKIKTIWPRGTIRSPGGKSYEWKVIDIKCQPSALF